MLNITFMVQHYSRMNKLNVTGVFDSFGNVNNCYLISKPRWVEVPHFGGGAIVDVTRGKHIKAKVI